VPKWNVPGLDAGSRKFCLVSIARRALFLSVVLAVSACNVDLYDKVDQKQANEIISVLFKNGIHASRRLEKDNLYAIEVDQGRLAEAITVLNDNGLPKQTFATMCDVFKGDGLVASPVQERAQMICALSGELERTISDVDGVITARVHLVLPENDPLRQRLIPSSASVFIRHVTTAPVADLTPQIKMLVANGIAGLSYDKVSVAFVPVEPPPAAAHPEIASGVVSVLGVSVLRDSRLALFGLALALILVGAGAGFAVNRFVVKPRKRSYALSDTGAVKS
jgi:type III secretion protein J